MPGRARRDEKRSNRLIEGLSIRSTNIVRTHRPSTFYKNQDDRVFRGYNIRSNVAEIYRSFLTTT